jgi:hypothetical protein
MASQIKGDSVKAQGLLEELFLPRSVLRAVKDIKTLQLQGQHQVSDTSRSHLHQATALMASDDIADTSTPCNC